MQIETSPGLFQNEYYKRNPQIRLLLQENATCIFN